MLTPQILIVDDEYTTRHALCEAFLQLGHTAHMAANGTEALRRLQQQFYHVVILDLHMPGDIKGLDVLIAAEEISPHTLFIILTAHATVDTAIRALRSGAHDYLQKPASLEVIFSATQKALEKQQEHLRHKKAVSLIEQAFSALKPSPETLTQPSATFYKSDLPQLVLYEATQTILYYGKCLNLTPVEFHLLQYLLKAYGTLCTYAELAWATHKITLPEEEARSLLRTHIFRLKKKLEEIHPISPLQVVRGRGLMLSDTPQPAEEK